MSRKTKPLTIPPEGMPLSVPQFSLKYGIGDATAWNWIAQGLLTATKIGPNVTRILPEHERAWLAKAQKSPNPKAA
jgi:hypothetical protein